MLGFRPYRFPLYLRSPITGLDKAVDIRYISLACRSTADRSEISPALSVVFKISP